MIELNWICPWKQLAYDIEKENKELVKEHKELTALLKHEKRRWKAISAEIAAIKKRFGPNKPFGRRRTEIRKPPTAVVVPLEAIIEKEPITIVASEKGWIRAIKGHVKNTADMKYKEGDRGRFALQAETTDKLVIFSTNGRFYTIGCDKLPGGRGDGEPLRLMVELANGHDVVAMFVHKPDRRLIVASESGRGFIVEENDVIAQTKNGKQVLNLGEDDKAAAFTFIGDQHDAIVVLGSKRKLLIFPLDELPSMSRGRGVILQRYNKGVIADITTLKFNEGLTWRSGNGWRTEPDIGRWVGKRAQSGQLPPKGFPRANRFT